jgi:hypothetical protein
MTTANGYYWCSHDLEWYVPPGKQYREGWNVVQVLDGNIWSMGGEVPLVQHLAPDYVEFIGPLQSPA